MDIRLPLSLPIVAFLAWGTASYPEAIKPVTPNGLEEKFALAETLRRGANGEADLGAAQDLHIALAEQGLQRSHLPLGLIYEKLGEPQKAIAAYQNALTAPNGSRARLRLAVGHLNSAFGAFSDPSLGFQELALIASEDGSAAARFELARALESGLGTAPDLQKAFLLYSELAQEGEAWAHMRLGQMYLIGKGRNADPSMAAAHFRAAVDKDVDVGLVGLSQAYVALGRTEDALATIEIAVEKDARRAEFVRASNHISGAYGSLSDATFGRAELKDLAEEGDIDAAFSALNMHSSGSERISDLDLEQVLSHLQSAAENGNGWATAALARAYRELSNEIPNARTRHSDLLAHLGDTMIPRMAVPEQVYALYDANRQRSSFGSMHALLAETENEGYVTGMVSLRRITPNAFVFALQSELGELGYSDCGRNAMLTTCTLKNVMRFCADQGISDTCKLGPLRAPVVRTISETLYSAKAGAI